ncbi:MAG TPA: alpha/beta hydrolase [Candidatus Binatia bacterium]|nr:alpha/beta hydrolase [Candidatus Binatia bacterium]
MDWSRVRKVVGRRRWYWRRRVLNGTFRGAALLADFVVERQAARDHIEILRDIRYGRHRTGHQLDIYRPLRPARPLPVLLYIHGGAFTLCSKDTHRSIALANARGAGYLVFNINYRLAPAHAFPAAISDACDAYRWVVEHCAAYGGDPSRIVLAGESAGGNLALGVAIAATYRRPEFYARKVWALGVVPVGVMPVTPYLQASDPARHTAAGYLALAATRAIAADYLGKRALPDERNLMADPVRILEECGAPQRPFPPVFSGVGDRDAVCWNDVKRLEKACRRLGIPITAHYYPNEIHAFHALQWRSASRLFWRRAFRFMKRVAQGASPRAALRAASGA